jgi:hypothetical protein
VAPIANEDEERRIYSYQFSPRPKHGLALGLSLQRLAGVLIGMGTALITMITTKSLIAAMIPAVLGAAWAWFPIRGRPAGEILPILGAHKKRTMANETLWTVPVTAQSLTPQFEIIQRKGNQRSLDWPPELGGQVTIEEVNTPYGRIAVVTDRQGYRSSHVMMLDVATESWQLADPADQDRRVAAWSAILSGLARDRQNTVRLQVNETLRPDSGVEQAEWLNRLAKNPYANPSEVERYRQMVVENGAAALRHETTVALRVPVAQTKESDPMQPSLRELELLLRGFQSAGFSVRPMDLAQTASRIRLVLTPDPRLATQEILPTRAGPSYRREEDRWVKIEDWLHSTHWISEWPRSQVRAAWMYGFLVTEPRAARTLSLHFEAVPPFLATRMAERERLAAQLDQAQRRRLGFVESANRRRELEGAEAREEELASGGALLRFVGLVDLATRDENQMVAARDTLAQLAAQNRMALIPLDGQQHLGLAACVPLGRLAFAKGWQA